MILQISKMYSPDIGGVESVVKSYCEILNEREEVIVLCVSKFFSIFTKREYLNGILIYRCASFGTFFSLPISVIFFFYLFRLSRRARIIHFHEPFPLASLGQSLVPRSKKVFVTWHSDIVKQKLFKPFVEFFQRLLCERADNIIATSANLAKFSGVIKAYSDKLKVIPLFINLNSYVAPKEVFFERLPKDYVLFLGRFSYYKGIVQLLDAFDRLSPHINLVIAGQGELSELVRSRVSKKNSCSVSIIDRVVSEEEKMFLLSQCRFFIFPSTLPSEAFGILQLEAMAFSKAVINTSLDSGVPWVSPHQVSGLTVPPGDVESLSQAIEYLYRHPGLAQRFGENGRQRVREYFDSQSVSKILIRLYFGAD